MRISIALIAAHILLGVTAANAQESTNNQLMEVRRLLQEVGGKLSDLVDDNRTLRQQVSDLKVKLEATVEMPSNAVTAFDLANGCPHGWSSFEPAKDKFIIGVGDKYKLPYIAGEPEYQTGGEETVALKIEHIPNHDHGMIKSLFGGRLVSPPPSTQKESWHVPTLEGPPSHTEWSQGGRNGKTVAHDNMPPYIALYLCKKD